MACMVHFAPLVSVNLYGPNIYPQRHPKLFFVRFLLNISLFSFPDEN